MSIEERKIHSAFTMPSSNKMKRSLSVLSVCFTFSLCFFTFSLCLFQNMVGSSTKNMQQICCSLSVKCSSLLKNEIQRRKETAERKSGKDDSHFYEGNFMVPHSTSVVSVIQPHNVSTETTEVPAVTQVLSKRPKALSGLLVIKRHPFGALSALFFEPCLLLRDPPVEEVDFGMQRLTCGIVGVHLAID